MRTAAFWPSAGPSETVGVSQTHVFVGPPGSGKTTVLCKWLTLAVLTEGRFAFVVRQPLAWCVIENFDA